MNDKGLFGRRGTISRKTKRDLGRRLKRPSGELNRNCAGLWGLNADLEPTLTRKIGAEVESLTPKRGRNVATPGFAGARKAEDGTRDPDMAAFRFLNTLRAPAARTQAVA